VPVPVPVAVAVCLHVCLRTCADIFGCVCHLYLCV
jgi:hypothetical protein